MSTVLWANYLQDGRVTSDEADKYALYKFSSKLEKLTRQLGVSSFADALDTTDAQLNVTDEALPDGMESSDQVMAAQGVWIAADDAVTMLDALIREIEDKNVKFGMLGNAKDDVLQELRDSLAFAQQAAERNARFNFSVVM